MFVCLVFMPDECSPEYFDELNDDCFKGLLNPECFGFSSFLFLLFSQFLWSSPSLLCFVELATPWLSLPMTSSLVQKLGIWLLYDIDLHPLLGADEGIGDTMVADHHCTHFC
jgi:hypothetical protein